MTIAEFSVVPLGMGTSVSVYVKEVIEVLKRRHVKYEVGAMSTTIEGDLSTILLVIEEAYESVFKAGAKRVVTTIKIDDRRDKIETMESKKKAVGIE